MFRCPCLPVLPILLSLFVFGSAAHGEPIQWNYTGQVMLTGPANSDYGPLSFTNLSGTGADSQSVSAFGVTLSENGYQQYSQNTHPFDVSFRLTDTASGQSGVFTFHGYLEGKTGVQEDRGYFEHIWAGYITGNYSNLSSQTLQLGNNLYKVAISPFQVGYAYDWSTYPPGYPGGPSLQGNPPPNSPLPVDTRGMVRVEVTNETPEPSTLALVASGLTALGCRFWRRRRRTQKEQPSLQRETNTADSR